MQLQTSLIQYRLIEKSHSVELLQVNANDFLSTKKILKLKVDFLLFIALFCGYILQKIKKFNFKNYKFLKGTLK